MLRIRIENQKTQAASHACHAMHELAAEELSVPDLS